jgi:hypothetical protein
MRNDSRINSSGTNKAAQGGDGSFIGWSSPSKPMKCPLPDCTCVIRPDEWEEHLQLHEIESALRQGEKERHDKREANDFDLLQRYNGGLLEEAEMYSPVDSPSLSAPSSQSSSVQKGAYVKQYIRSLERDCGAHRLSLVEAFKKKDKLMQLMQGPDTETLTPDVIPALKACYQGRGMYGIGKVMICSAASHYAYGRGDDGWGCGYRNIQMMCSGLMSNEVYKAVLFEGKGHIPSIPVIQAFIEQAWARGYDEEGAKQLGFSLSGGKKWIGSMECAALLRSFGIDCTVVDFFRATGPDGTHPELLNWVWNYFSAYYSSPSSPPCPDKSNHSNTTLDSFFLQPPSSSSSSSSSSASPSLYSTSTIPSGAQARPERNTRLLSDVAKNLESSQRTHMGRRPSGGSSSSSPSLYSSTFVPPIFLQHEGHSRTIVGIEKRKNGTLHLLILDPVHTGQKVTTTLAARQRRIFRHSINGLKHRQYQLVAVEAAHACRLMSLQEMEESKILRTVRIPSSHSNS